jgi:hypothetical protein
MMVYGNTQRISIVEIRDTNLSPRHTPCVSKTTLYATRRFFAGAKIKVQMWGKFIQHSCPNAKVAFYLKINKNIIRKLDS